MHRDMQSRNIGEGTPAIHTYANKMFGSIPVLFVAEPFSSGTRYSQLCITYLVSYIRYCQIELVTDRMVQ